MNCSLSLYFFLKKFRRPPTYNLAHPPPLPESTVKKSLAKCSVVTSCLCSSRIRQGVKQPAGVRSLRTHAPSWVPPVIALGSWLVARRAFRLLIHGAPRLAENVLDFGIVVFSFLFDKHYLIIV